MRCKEELFSSSFRLPFENLYQGDSEKAQQVMVPATEPDHLPELDPQTP